MAGLVPAIHDFLFHSQDIDARHEVGHDENGDDAFAGNDKA